MGAGDGELPNELALGWGINGGVNYRGVALLWQVFRSNAL